MSQTYIDIDYLHKSSIPAIKEGLLNLEGFQGNWYCWFQYKNDEFIVIDEDRNYRDERPSFDLSRLLYVEFWDYPMCQLLINPKLPIKTQKQIILTETLDENGNPYYGKINYSKNIAENLL
mgnify:CR=1 FL=1